MNLKEHATSHYINIRCNAFLCNADIMALLLNLIISVTHKFEKFKVWLQSSAERFWITF